MKRREFLKRGVVFVGTIAIGGSLIYEVKQPNEIKIIHKPENTTVGMLDGWSELAGIRRMPNESDRDLRQRVVDRMRLSNVSV